MGQPVVHFEIMGKDGEALRSYYSELFGWKIDANNPMNYGMISAEGNQDSEGVGIGGGVGQLPEGMDPHLTFYIAVDDVEEALKKAESLGGTRIHGPSQIEDMLILGHFSDPEGNMVGVMKPL